MKLINRRVKLRFYNNNQEYIIEKLRITFSIVKNINPEPNSGEIQIYNLNEESRNKLTNKEYPNIELYIGIMEEIEYLLFKGTITQVSSSYNGVDKITKITALDGYKFYSEKAFIKTIKKDTSDKTVLAMAINDFGIEKGAVFIEKEKPTLRSRTFVTTMQGIFNRLAGNNNCEWYIENEQLQFIAKNYAIKTNERLIISRETGLLGTPQKNITGVSFVTLCDPRYQIGSLIEIASKIIELNGIYKIQEIKHAGDTMSSQWTSNVNCLTGVYKEI